MIARRAVALLAASICLLGILGTMTDTSARTASQSPKPAPYPSRVTPPLTPLLGNSSHDLDDSDDRRRNDDLSWRRLGAFATFLPLTAAAEEKRFGPAATNGAATAEKPAVFSPPVALPTWQLGDKFIYDDGSWEQLVAIEGDSLRFINQDGEVFLRAPDFTLPARHFQKPDGQTGDSQILPAGAEESGGPSLWPLATDKISAFIETNATQRNGSKEAESRALWRCRVLAAATKTAAAGNYACQQIVCRRLGGSDQRILEEIHWYYAPAIQYWLGRETQLPNDKWLYRELAAIFPDLRRFTANGNEEREIRQQWQDSLATTPKGETDLWLAADGSRSVAITPGPAFRRQDGSLCRRYSQRVQAPSFDRVYPGMACENPAGAWQTPRQ